MPAYPPPYGRTTAGKTTTASVLSREEGDLAGEEDIQLGRRRSSRGGAPVTRMDPGRRSAGRADPVRRRRH
jgi:hypothetical protein